MGVVSDDPRSRRTFALASACALATIALTVQPAHATTGIPSLEGVLAVLVGILGVVPWSLLEWAIVRVRGGKAGWYLALPALLFLLLDGACIVAAFVQGIGASVDGLALMAFFVFTAWRLWVFRSRAGAESKPRPTESIT